MAFNNGTQQKCKACDKTVYIAEMLSNYSSMDGVLYCKPHFEQTLKEKGVTVRSQSCYFIEKKSYILMQARTPSKLSSVFSGTQEKCATCNKTVYPLEKVTVDGYYFHQNCFKCSHGGCKLTTSSYAALDGLLYCKPHFSQLFKEKGSYNNLNRSTSGKKSSGAQEVVDTDELKPEDSQSDIVGGTDDAPAI
ncbi:hypothetical protein DM860_011666 [Cuscuta australis]|uniref:LIM zinc-binding domain-containing protein n=1 Tax=Cuscuta australis TaxID=267555 RepID=A0A328DJ99_9ASTE|nr:hypothetical protein DM860_011666 [Cuscuta australis]